MADRGNQFVIGVFVATFLYSLLVLRSIRVRDDGSGSYFVPHLAVNVAMLRAVLAISARPPRDVEELLRRARHPRPARMSTVSRWRRRRPGTSKVSTRRTCSRWPANTT